MSDGAVTWKAEPDEHDYPAAASYLALIAGPAQVDDLVKRLHALDWNQAFEWSSDEALRARVVGAAVAVGLEAVRVSHEDDGHWGGHQLRNTQLLQLHGGLCFDAIVAGFGFELDEFDVLEECRARLHHPDDAPDDMEDLVAVRLDLLPLLAYPFGEWQKPPALSTSPRITP